MNLIFSMSGDMSLQWFIRIAALLMFVLPGSIALYISLRGSKWFFESRSNRFVTGRLGLKWSRVLYFLLGILLLGAALLIWVDPKGTL